MHRSHAKKAVRLILPHTTSTDAKDIEAALLGEVRAEGWV